MKLLGEQVEGGRALELLRELLEGEKEGKLLVSLCCAGSLRRGGGGAGLGDREFGAGLGGEAA